MRERVVCQGLQATRWRALSQASWRQFVPFRGAMRRSVNRRCSELLLEMFLDSKVNRIGRRA